MTTESLNFVVSLSARMWSKKPQFSIWVDDHPVLQSELPDNQGHTFKFTHEIGEGDHTLKIRLENKDSTDTANDENGNIINDMLLNIDNIEIDEISIGSLLWTAEYHLDEPHEYQGETITRLDHCVNLGWNGTYVLKFTSPFYLWLLEKL